ncbi:uncharacterized protein KY384_007941 [Bacidia gigantensis]|uniref:uncharacterized protein n=1 Tax=Bacidia gigantensis TaxID=2732470 RepID=UPI001D044085|nr:uncharacterized protein KY384_007941 [Bacidia gigantensis]KAG8527787.1 hypothetical protein KY384_007941 [Bacidia gigantensis]
MSFGFSIGDIRVICQTIIWFHDKCFTKAQGAHVQYSRFGREIQSLAKNLRDLVDVAEHAAEQRPRRPWGNHSDDCREALKPLLEAAGDFQATIKDCQKLLDDHNRFQRDAAGFIDNVQWHMGTQRDVDILRERVEFHSTKILVLTKPFELHLLLEIRHELQEVRLDLREIRGLLITVLANGKLPDTVNLEVSLPQIPVEIEERFHKASKMDSQGSPVKDNNMPLVEGFDALVYQFARSTVEFNPVYNNTPDEEQFVNLLKSKWIMERLEKSLYLELEGRDSFWASYLRELKTNIIQEYGRFHTRKLRAPPQDAIVLLPDQCFTIWAKQAPPLRPPDLAEKRHEEELLLELNLPESAGSYTTALTVFKRSAIEFRFVTSTKHSMNPGDYQKEVIINTDVIRVVPAYAIPDAGANNILLSSSHVKDPRWQYLSSFEDVKALQHVLTGYRVHHSMENVTWSINGSSSPGKIGKGVLQLWQRQVLPVPSENSPRPPMQRATSTSSPNSSNLKRASTTLSTATTFVSGCSMTTVVNGTQSDATAVLMPENPVLVLMTLRHGIYTIIHLELEAEVAVNPKKCECRKPGSQCQVAVLKSTNKHMQIRRHSTQGTSESDLDNWDLARFRMPRHPLFKKVEVVPKSEHLWLEFPSADDKEEFRQELRELEIVRRMDLDTYFTFLQVKKRQDSKPGKKRGR